MDSHKIKAVLIMLIVVFAALYLGVAAASAQFEAIAWVMGGLGVALILALGKHVWVLIPIALQLAGEVSLVPGNPAPWWGAAAVTMVIFTVRICLRTQNFTFRWTWLDFAILLQMIAVGQAFVRNPTGLAVFGGDVVGGKPYIAFGFAFMAFALLSIVKADLKVIKWVVIGMVIMSLMDGALMFATSMIPALGRAILPFYSGISFDTAVGGVANTDTADKRLVGAKSAGEDMGKAVFSLFRPISTLNPLKPVRFLMMGISVGLILISGFRSVLGLVGMYAVVSSLVRRKPADLVVIGSLGLLVLTGLIVTNSVEKLPFGAQRILSVLPVDVRSDAKLDAENSSEWRFEMWELALTTDRYIKNKFLGDGFAFRSDELAIMRDAAFGVSRMTSQEERQELMMAKGSYHGFHVENIRMTGAFGLLLSLIALGVFFRYAWIQIQYFRGRPEWSFILFLCIPFLIHPFYLLLIFGAYRLGFPEILVASGMLKVLDNIRVAELSSARRIKREVDHLAMMKMGPPSGVPVSQG